jgi:O-antigen ligase
MFIVGSRSPSQWLGGQVGISAQAFSEGNPLDRSIELGLILLTLGVLSARSFKWASFVERNLALTAFVFLALLSVCWSDFPFVAFKRWFRDLGSYLMVLVVLTDPHPLEAIRTLLRRLCFLLIPLSIVLVKYYPDIGNSYDPWSGLAMHSGVTTSKNMLGVACLISGLFFFWDTVMRWPERKQRRAKRIILVNGTLLAMTLWLLNQAHSTTSGVCLILGSLVIVAAQSKVFRRNPTLLKVLIPAFFCLYLILDFGFDMNGSMARAVGKDPTLTDRTKIWGAVLGMHTNPLVGTGYQSFWLGPRLDWFWRNAGLGHINEAHNGFLEVYLDLGIIGDTLLVVFLIASYRTICTRFSRSPSLSIFGLATWLAIVFYDMSEAGFGLGLLYSVFLLSAIAPPESAKSRIHVVSAFDSAGTTDQFPKLSLEFSSQRR